MNISVEQRAEELITTRLALQKMLKTVSYGGKTILYH